MIRYNIIMEEKIVATFSLGRIVTARRQKIVRLGLYVLGGCQILILVILIIIAAAGNFMGENNEGFVLLGLNFFFFFFLALGFINYRINKQRKNKIKLWLCDAVELKAKILRIDMPMISEPYQVEVYFKYDNKNFVRTSRNATFWTGYQNVFNKYHGKYIRILYSPKYDEIIIPMQ